MSSGNLEYSWGQVGYLPSILPTWFCLFYLPAPSLQHFELFPLQVLLCLLSARGGLVEGMLEPLFARPARGAAPCSSLTADPALPRHSLLSWTAPNPLLKLLPGSGICSLIFRPARRKSWIVVTAARITKASIYKKRVTGSDWVLHHARFKFPVILVTASLANLGSSFFHSAVFLTDTFCKATMFSFF